MGFFYNAIKNGKGWLTIEPPLKEKGGGMKLLIIISKHRAIM